MKKAKLNLPALKLRKYIIVDLKGDQVKGGGPISVGCPPTDPGPITGTVGTVRCTIFNSCDSCTFNCCA
ncbi:hypothetical protein [Taibaiella helva]|uniref:hypothetical protein n=1 Tax=Taibaiella helva TaxID=2301235 RepID=UPI001300B2EC|nr:hypothetical protein [Taibaiella helva]